MRSSIHARENHSPWNYLAAAGGALYLGLRLYWLLHRNFMIDETEHLHAAWCMARGLTLYKDFFEHHGPILYWMLLPVVRVFHDPVQALWAGRALMMLIWTGICMLYLVLGHKKWTGSEKVIALAILCSFTTFAQFTLEIRPDVPATCLLLGMFVLGLNPDASWKLLMMGACFSAGLLCSPKIIFPAAGFLAGFFFSQDISKRCLLRRSALVGTGFIMALIFILTSLWKAGNLASFYRWFFVFNWHLVAGPYNHWFYTFSSLTQNPVLWGLAISALYYHRGPLSLKIALITWILGIFFRIPMGQYFILGGPLLAYFASALVIDLLRSSLREEDQWLLVGIALSFIWSFYVQVRDFGSAHDGNSAQIANIRYVMAHTQPNEKVLSPIDGDAVFRMHPGFFGWIIPDIEETLGSTMMEEAVVQELSSPLCAGFIVPNASYLRQHPQVFKFLLEHYRRTPPGRLYLRKPDSIIE